VTNDETIFENIKQQNVKFLVKEAPFIVQSIRLLFSNMLANNLTLAVKCFKKVLKNYGLILRPH